MSDFTQSLGQNSVSPSNATFFSPAYLEKRRLAMEAIERAAGFTGADEFEPSLPAGHAYAVQKSTQLSSYTKRHQRKSAMDITPQDVIDVLNLAGVKEWVLMGLHGYVGYMPNPPATQDVDILVSCNSRAAAKKAIATHWPALVVRELSQMTRFLDPTDRDSDGQPKPIVDLMHPWSPFQELILKEYVIVDKETQHRLPTLEAALASKYAAIISPYRDRDRKEI